MMELPVAWPIIGGLLIGLSAALYVLLLGRVAGISGILASALGLSARDARWQSRAFIAGSWLGCALALSYLRPATLTVTSSTATLLLAGLLVGFGTRMGGGCTTGHGVCGLARLAPRSIVATGVFMLVAAITVFLMRHYFVGGAA